MIADAGYGVDRGKCSFKLLTYLACGVPAVASPWGMNADVIAAGEAFARPIPPRMGRATRGAFARPRVGLLGWAHRSAPGGSSLRDDVAGPEDGGRPCVRLRAEGRIEGFPV